MNLTDSWWRQRQKTWKLKIHLNTAIRVLLHIFPPLMPNGNLVRELTKGICFYAKEWHKQTYDHKSKIMAPLGPSKLVWYYCPARTINYLPNSRILGKDLIVFSTENFTHSVWSPREREYQRADKLTRNCIRYPDLPLVHKGVSMESPTKATFPPDFLIIFTPCVYTYHFKMVANNRFSFRVISISAKFEKTLSQRNFSMKFGSN